MNGEDPVHCCSMCDFQCYSVKALLKHIKSTHENDPRFLVYCSLCSKSMKRWSSLKKHLHREHRNAYDTSTGGCHSEDGSITETSCDGQHLTSSEHDAVPSTPFIDPKWDQALFLLKATEQHSLTYSGIESLCDSTQQLVEAVVDQVASKVKSKLQEHNTDMNTDLEECIEDACQPVDIFEGLRSRYCREKYYETHFNYVEPKLVAMDEHWVWVVVSGEMKMRKATVKGYIIDPFDGLKALLSNPAVREEISLCHASNDDVMRDICDGKFVHKHPVFCQHSDALQFLLYYDDIEICNALGAKAGKHKLGVFYYLLGNIRPLYRSSLQAMQLVAIAKSSDIHTYGSESLLQSFVESTNLLARDEGYPLFLHGDEVLFHGAIVSMCGDTPASNFVGGFKEGVGFALRKCRMCMATSDDINTKFRADQFVTRDLTSHEQYCERIEADSGRAGYSVTYGINRASILMEAHHFDVTKCLPYDIMHTVFEGVVPYHLKMLLQSIINHKGYLTLQQFNHAFSVHCFGYSESDTKPSPIEQDRTDSSTFHIRQSASQMMTLVRLLPFVIGDFIPEDDDHWRCFLLLWDICCLSTAFEVTKADAAQLGPLRYSWCMRFESKNKQLKQFTSCCFKNVPFSIAQRHQQMMAYLLAVKPGAHTSTFLYRGDEVLSGCSGVVDESIALDVANICGLEEVPNPFVALRATSVKIHGVRYSTQVVVRVRTPPAWSVDDPFIYCRIQAIVVYQDHKIFLLKALVIVRFCEHLKSFEVEDASELLLVTYHDFYRSRVLHVKDKHNKHYLIEKDHADVCF